MPDYKNLKVLVTGTTGFKGSWLSLWLNKIGAKVFGVSLKPDKESVLFKSLSLYKKINQTYINIINFNKINSLIKNIKPDIVFHLAAQSIVSESYFNPLKTFETNIMGSVNVLESVRRNKVPNLVYITSDKCYSNLGKKKIFTENDKLGGNDNYSASKASAEIIFNSYYNSYFKLNKLHYATARAGNVIGGGDFNKNRIVPDIINSIFLKKKLILRNPIHIRPWQHVFDPLYGYLLLGEKLLSNKLKSSIIPSWNFGPSIRNCKNVKALSNLILKSFNIKNKVILNLNNKNFNESKFLLINSKKAKKELNWESKLNFHQSVNLTVDWYKNFYLRNNKNISNYNFSLNQIEKFEEILN